MSITPKTVVEMCQAYGSLDEDQKGLVDLLSADELDEERLDLADKDSETVEGVVQFFEPLTESTIDTEDLDRRLMDLEDGVEASEEEEDEPLEV